MLRIESGAPVNYLSIVGVAPTILWHEVRGQRAPTILMGIDSIRNMRGWEETGDRSLLYVISNCTKSTRK